jgi:DNA-binding transcriptional LysR family regulator
MAALPPVANLMAFEAVARRRSFALAAAELHLTASAISHQVARLEAHLGARLLERSAHGVRLSPAGERYLARIGGALAAIAAASDDVRQGMANTLYVHASPSLATLWLMPRLPRFAQAHPEIALNLSAAHIHSDFALGPVDLDIRYGVPQWPGLVVEPLFEERILPLASPAFIRRHRLARVEQILGVPLIQSNVNVVQWGDWLGAFTKQRAPDRFSLRFDRAQMAMDAAVQGLGVALESATIGARHLAEGTLRPVFGLEKAVRVKAHFAVYPARHGKRAPVEAFLAWLHGEASRPETAAKGAPKGAPKKQSKASDGC